MDISDESSSKSSSIERVRVLKKPIERVSSEYLESYSSTRAFFEYSSTFELFKSFDFLGIISENITNLALFGIEVFIIHIP